MQASRLVHTKHKYVNQSRLYPIFVLLHFHTGFLHCVEIFHEIPLLQTIGEKNINSVTIRHVV